MKLKRKPWNYHTRGKRYRRGWRKYIAAHASCAGRMSLRSIKKAITNLHTRNNTKNGARIACALDNARDDAY